MHVRFDYDFTLFVQLIVRTKFRVEIELYRTIRGSVCLFVGWEIFTADDYDDNGPQKAIGNTVCVCVCNNSLICKYDCCKSTSNVCLNIFHNIEFWVCYCILYGKLRVIKLFIRVFVCNMTNVQIFFVENASTKLEKYIHKHAKRTLVDGILISNYWHNLLKNMREHRPICFVVMVKLWHPFQREQEGPN